MIEANVPLPEEITLFKREVRAFVQREVEPVSTAIDETDEIPVGLIDKARELGLFGITIPEEYGGLGLDIVGKCAIEEELGRSNYGFATLVGNHTGVSTTGILHMGSPAQRARYLPRMATGEWIGAFALTEPQAGSDASSLRTSADRRGDRWILNGEKIFITNAPVASVFTVMAVTDPNKGPKGISAFIVERGTPGLRVGPNEKKMGMRGSRTSSVSFEDCEVPAENLLGAPGEGYVTALKVLTRGRVIVAARCVGAMERMLELAATYGTSREQFGRPIAANQAIQFMLADMATELMISRLTTYHVAERLERGERASAEAAMCKVFVTEAANRCADRAVQIFGGMGYIRETPVERFYRDLRVTRIYEGTSEIQRLIIASDLLKRVETR